MPAVNPIERFRLMRIQKSFENFSESDKTSLHSLSTTNENIKSSLTSLNKNILSDCNDSDTNADSEDSSDSDDSSFSEDNSESGASSDEDSFDSDSSSSDESDEQNHRKKDENQLYSNGYKLITKKEDHHSNNYSSDNTDSDSSESESDENHDSIGKHAGNSKVKVCVLPPPPPPPLPDFILTIEPKLIVNKRTMESVRSNLEKGMGSTLDQVMQELLAGRCMLKPVNSRQLRKVQPLPNSQDLQGTLAAALKKRLKSINKNENEDSAYDDSQGSQSELEDCEPTKESVQIYDQH